MTPKEKAEQLIEKHLTAYDIEPIALKSAIITIDEILSNNVLKHRTCGYELITSSHVEYWQQVKRYINKNYDV